MTISFRSIFLLLMITLSGLLVACSPKSSLAQNPDISPVENQVIVEPQDEEVEVDSRGDSQEQDSNRWYEEEPRIDKQGAVIVEILPLNLNYPGQLIDFQVSLDTHSVDLSMDLAVRATLETDSGNIVQALAWDAPRGGHHVSGTLSFPSEMDGISLLDRTAKVTIRLLDVDASERIFSWER